MPGFAEGLTTSGEYDNNGAGIGARITPATQRPAPKIGEDSRRGGWNGSQEG